MKFSDIPSHDSVKERLRAMADTDRLPHALLFEGPQGTGKLAMARTFAQYIHCTDRHDGEPCGRCPSCLQHQAFNHIDTHFVYPVVKGEKDNTPPVSDDFADDWKDFLASYPWADFEAWRKVFPRKNAQPVIYVTESENLIHKLAFTSHGSRYRIVIIWLPERMNVETANKLLKIIEEPYHDTIFLMVSDAPDMILPTVYSRVQRVEMKRYSDGVVAQFLMAHSGLSDTDAVAQAHLAEGNLNTALANLCRSADVTKRFERFVALMRLAYQRKVKELKEWSEELSALGREEEMAFYDYALRMMRENFVYNFRVPQLNYLNRQEADFSVNFARFINEHNVERMVTVFDDARRDIAANTNGKIVNFDLAIKIILLIKAGVEK
ncbi:MAG: DNA polymerase III subunit delta [Bacteroides sp.]|nr:DNA polymerase III subunit delta [Bacteroidales bacterium]MBD5315605.1 DNA polymerase III subunit delta [Bacteroides sp.]